MQASQVIADARRQAGSFSPLPPPETSPVIIAVSGLPGAGKSYFCRKLAERLPFIILESDALRKQLFPVPSHSAGESACLFRAIHRLIEEMLKKGVSVILDATNLAEKHREIIYKIAGRAGARLIMVNVEAPPEVVRRRLKARAEGRTCNDHSDADWAVYRKMKATAEKIGRRHYTVNTSKDISTAIEKIVKEANR